MEFCFFTDTDIFQLQSSAIPFGPISSSSTHDEYRVVSLHSLPPQYSPKAYAVSNGLIFAQEVNSTTVNLIIKPTEQPGEGLSNIEYIIYKGIQRNSLLNGNTILTNSSLKLVERINASQVSRFGSQNTPAAPKEALGLHLDNSIYTDTESIEKLFFHGGLYQPPPVYTCDSIGVFDPSQFGLEIICKRLGYNAPLEAARYIDHVLREPKLPISPQPTQDQEFQHWHNKEALLSYIDPAAFYGGMFLKGVYYRVSASNTVNSYVGNPLYDNIIDHFLNKNTAYLDIRNERNNSVDYYNDFGRNIEFEYSATATPSPTNFYSDGWPLKRIIGSLFPLANNGVKNILQLKMPLIASNPLPLLYVHHGYPDKKLTNAVFPKAPQQTGCFLDLTPNPNNPTEPIVSYFALRNRSGQNTTKLISDYIKVSYVRQRDEVAWPSLPPPGALNFGAMHFADNLFPIFEMTVPYTEIPNTSQVRMKTYPEAIYLDDPKYSKEEYVVSLGTAIDNDNITFFATPTKFKTSIGQTQRKALVVVSADVKGQDDFLKYVAFASGNHVLSKRKILPTGTQNELFYIAYESQNLLPLTNSLYVSLVDFISITITKTEFSQLTTLKNNTGFAQNYRVYMGLKLIDAESGQDSLLQLYRTYEIILRGYKVQNNSIAIENVSTGIKVITYGSK